MTTPSPDREPLAWLAFQYVARELSAAEMAAFELRLAEDEAAQDEVARAVELWQAVDAAKPVEAVAHSTRETNEPIHATTYASHVPTISIAAGGAPLRPLLERLAWMAGGVAACLAAVWATSSAPPATGVPHPSEELARLQPRPAPIEASPADHASPSHASPNRPSPNHLPVHQLPQGWAAELAVLPRDGVDGGHGLNGGGHAADDSADSDAWLAARWEADDAEAGEAVPSVPTWLIEALSREGDAGKAAPSPRPAGASAVMEDAVLRGIQEAGE